MSMTRGPVDLSADQQEEACVAFEKAASIVLEYLKLKSIDLQFPIIDSGNLQLPLDYGLLDKFRTGIERARRRLYYKAFLKIIELNSWLIIDHIPAAHKSTADQAFRLLTVSGEIFEGCKQSWSKNLTASVGDSGLASWFGMESSSRKISIANVSAVMAKCAAQFAVFRMVDLFLQAAKIVHEHNQNASLTDEDWLVNENSRPLFANGAMEDFHKLADVYERTT